MQDSSIYYVFVPLFIVTSSDVTLSTTPEVVTYKMTDTAIIRESTTNITCIANQVRTPGHVLFRHTLRFLSAVLFGSPVAILKLVKHGCGGFSVSASTSIPSFNDLRRLQWIWKGL